MDRLGHSQLSTTQRYPRTLDTTNDTALTAFLATRDRDRQPQNPSQPESGHPSSAHHEPAPTPEPPEGTSLSL